MKVNFTPSMLSFLKASGYTHIYNEGIIEGTDHYLLLPLMPGNSRFIDIEVNDKIEDINSQDVHEMAGGDEFITFVVQVSSAELEQYKITLT